MPIVFGLTILLRHFARIVTRQGTRAMAAVNDNIQESVTGISVAKNFRQEAMIYDAFDDVNHQSYAINLRRGFVLATIFPALNTVGGIADAATPGTMWVPQQIIDYTWGREGSFHDGVLLPLDHVECSEPFDAGVRELLLAAGGAAGVCMQPAGVYGCTQGPRLETAAEIERLRRDGCDLVGMTAMPEAVLARELGLGYAMLAMVVNRAAGCSDEPITMERVRERSALCLEHATRVLTQLALLTVAC